MALSADTPRVFENTGGHPSYNNGPIVADDIIYAGSAVSINSAGNFRPLTVADANFAGFAVQKYDNEGGSAGDLDVEVMESGRVKLSVTGVTGIGDVPDTVYATDDGTFTLTASGGVSIGKVARYESGTTVMVDFEATNRRSL